MFTLFKSANSGKIKGYKITNPARDKKYGVAANSFNNFKKKASEKFKIPKCRFYLSTDGTEITDEDYFATIPEQTLIVVAGEKDEIKTDFQLFEFALRNRSKELLDAGHLAQEFIVNNRDYIAKCLKDLKCDNSISKESFSKKSEDPDWFAGPDEKYSTKEEVMIRRAQDRIRGYFYKTKDEILTSEIYKNNLNAKKYLDEILSLFKQFLFGCDFFGCLFDRGFSKYISEDTTDSGERLSKRTKLAIEEVFDKTKLFEDQCIALCAPNGEFQCQGVWSLDKCNYENHSINPYRSRENLIVFQMWNLDHQIEISRSVLPALLNCVAKLIVDKEKCPLHKEPGLGINVLRFFEELFTISNLKLVHIACHDKTSHGLESKAHIICRKCPEYKTVNTYKKFLAKSISS